MKINKKELLFLLVGGYNTAFGFLLTNLVLYIFHDNYVILSLVFTYLIQLIHNFFTFEKLVFKSNVKFLTGIIRMNNGYMVIVATNFLAISFLVYFLDLNDNLAYNIVFPFLLIGQYLIHKKYTFR